MEPPFDRGEIDRASLEATERLRARLSGRPATAPVPPRRSVLPWVLAVMLFVFVAGMIANPWFERAVRKRLPFATATTTPAAPAPEDIKVLQSRIAELEAAAAPGMPAGERLARTEAQIETSVEQLARDSERIDKLTGEVAALATRIETEAGRTEAASATAIAAADRAQAMIAVLLARNALAAGRRLGNVEPVLRAAFEARYPQAVTAVVALGTAPVTLDTLRRDFAALSAAGGPAGMDWWDSLAAAVRSAVSRPGEGGKAPQEAAAAALARGDVAGAAAQLRRLPTPRPAAVNSWLAAADRWQAGMTALVTLETAAVVPLATPPPVVAKPVV